MESPEQTIRSWTDTYRGMSSDNAKGLILAMSSSVFIGASFIIKKKGLKKAGASGLKAGAGGYTYLLEPLWWVGLISIIMELSCSAVLAHIVLHERLHIFGMLGCVLCIVGSTTIVLHAPQEQEINSVMEVWDLATEPAFIMYASLVVAAVFIIITHYIPQYGQTHIIAYIGVCSLIGSVGVMSVRALGIAIKLTLSGTNQLLYPQTWAFAVVVVTCVLTQLNYLNKDWDGQNATQIVTELCGFVTILSGTFLLHKTDLGDYPSSSKPIKIQKYLDMDRFNLEEAPLGHLEAVR